MEPTLFAQGPSILAMGTLLHHHCAAGVIRQFYVVYAIFASRFSIGACGGAPPSKVILNGDCELWFLTDTRSQLRRVGRCFRCSPYHDDRSADNFYIVPHELDMGGLNVLGSRLLRTRRLTFGQLWGSSWRKNAYVCYSSAFEEALGYG